MGSASQPSKLKWTLEINANEFDKYSKLYEILITIFYITFWTSIWIIKVSFYKVLIFNTTSQGKSLATFLLAQKALIN